MCRVQIVNILDKISEIVSWQASVNIRNIVMVIFGSHSCPASCPGDITAYVAGIHCRVSFEMEISINIQETN